jgi:peroxiredoxin (alkyl hydroperoxide reductase subunit C)
MQEIKTIQIGETVPNFSMETYEPSKKTFGSFSLKDSIDQKKWTVLVFYPADFTFVCPTELQYLSEKHQELNKMDVNLISVSIDTKFVHMAWQEEEKLLKDVKYPMGSDTKGEIAKIFGVYDYNSGLAYRGTFIINPEGVLVASEINLNNVGRNMDELVRKIKAFIHCYKNPAEVCPAKWKEGGKTLKPSEKLVGKVYKELE